MSVSTISWITSDKAMTKGTEENKTEEYIL